MTADIPPPRPTEALWKQRSTRSSGGGRPGAGTRDGYREARTSGWLVVLLLLLTPGAPFRGHVLAGPAAVTTPTAPRRRTAAEEARRVRGLERDAGRPLNPARVALAAVAFVPRQALDALLYGSERGALTFGTEDFILRAKEFFYLVDDQLAWYPSAALSSGYRPLFGGGLAYHHDLTAASAAAGYNSRDKWQAAAQVSRRWRRGGTSWELTLAALANRDDDLQFFGIGARPRTDRRSFFLPGAGDDHATYSQRRSQVGLVLAAVPAPAWQLTLTSFYQRREVFDIGSRRFATVFDVAALPGARRRTEQWYSELAVLLDTRPPEPASAGVRLESYSGFSLDVEGDGSDYWRGGADGAVFLPVFHRHRLIVARAILDAQRQVHDDPPLAFTEYPRHPQFRGVSTRKLFRSDERSLLSSLEYQWPVGPTVGGHLFVDHLMVADEISGLSAAAAEWAAGFGVDFHLGEHGLGGLQLVTGSEGFRLLLSAGFEGGSQMRAGQK